MSAALLQKTHVHTKVLNAQRDALSASCRKLKHLYILVNSEPITRFEIRNKGYLKDAYFYDPHPNKLEHFYVYQKVMVPDTFRVAMEHYVNDAAKSELSSDQWTEIGVVPPSVLNDASGIMNANEKRFGEVLGAVKELLSAANLYSDGDDVGTTPLFNSLGYREKRIPFFHLDMGIKDEREGKSFYVLVVTDEPKHSTVVINEQIPLQEFSRCDIHDIMKSSWPEVIEMFPYGVKELSIDLEMTFYESRSKAIQDCIDAGDLTTSHLPTGTLVKMNRTPHCSPTVISGREHIPRMVLGVFITKNIDVAPAPSLA